MGQRGRPRTPDAERFWRKVDTTNGPDACWLWRGALTPSAYGIFHSYDHGDKMIGAHRWSYLNAGGEIPEGKQLHHTCNVPACVNPKHLEPVTQQQNIDAIVERARRAPIKFGTYRRTGEKASTIAFHCPDALQYRLRTTADALNTSMGYLICAALTQFFALRLDEKDEGAA